MSHELPKTYDPAAIEPETLAAWTDEKLYHADPSASGEPYAIVIPPPNVTAALHLGHALNNTLQDILIRWRRMAGDNAVWLPGTDHAGIATQTVVEKRVLAEEGKRRTDFSRNEFVAKIQAWKDEYEARITEQLKRMGCSCDWDRQAFTMDQPRARAVREAFFRLFKDGLIYRGKRLVNWDPVTQTALADDEVEMEEIDGHFYYLRYPLVEESDDATTRRRDGGEENASPSDPSSLRRFVAPSLPDYVTVATTRPETMLGDTAVAINPKDPLAAQLRGQFVRLPIVNRVVPIIEDDYVVLPDGDSDDPKAKYATGFLKVTPAHDPNDYEIGQRHNLPMVNVMAPDATISDQHGWPADDFAQGGEDLQNLLGLDRYEARQAVVEWFRRNNLLEDVKPYRHTVGHSYRSHVPIEPYLSDQWYVATKKQIPTLPDEGLIEGTDVPRNSLAGLALSALDTPPQSPDRKGGVSGDATEAVAHAPGSEAEMPPPQSPDREGGGSRQAPEPWSNAAAYFITFTTYGTWLHGRDAGSVDDEHNIFGQPVLSGNPVREQEEFRQLKHAPVALDADRRRVVQRAILDVCHHRGWTAHAVHVRGNHVHVLVTAEQPPERVMNDFKAYATRALRASAHVPTEGRVWTQHGSTRYVWKPQSVPAAIDYVVNQQGAMLDPMPYRRSTEPAGPGAHAPGSEAAVPALQSPDREGGVSVESTGPVAYAPGSETTLRIIPERYARTYQTWHENIRDWCISRQLWWGHRIPVWRHDAVPSGAIEWVRIQPESRVQLVTNGNAAFVCLRDAPEQDGDAWLIKGRLEIWGFTQDPDVLDTWFSSALWPLSTLGWPEETAELRKWNPTSVLCTAREIITLWVGRMVMFNRYFRATSPQSPDRQGGVSEKTIGPVAHAPGSESAPRPGPVPFYDVFVHAMIQDGEGRKMSKSLGNGVDPLDIIESHGADAMRFTLASMTTHTQDVRMPVEKDPKTGKNTSPKFDNGRNFCNKLWNAARFALMNLGESDEATKRRSDAWEDSASDFDPSSLRRSVASSLPDRWILSRLARTIDEANQALQSYRFDQYARTCYDFFWRDFCDWYVEAIKPAMKDPQRVAGTRQVLAAVLDASLRLMHPMIPFITEKIYWNLCELMPQGRGIPGKLMGCTSGRLMTAAWPRADASLVDESAEGDFTTLQEIIGAIRNLRNEHKVEPKRVADVSIKAPAELAGLIQDNAELVELLGTCRIKAGGADLPIPQNAARTMGAGVEIYAEGLVDEQAEQQRLAKRREEVTRQISALKGRLGNENYIRKAPPHLVQQTRDQLEEAEAELAKLG